MEVEPNNLDPEFFRELFLSQGIYGYAVLLRCASQNKKDKLLVSDRHGDTDERRIKTACTRRYILSYGNTNGPSFRKNTGPITCSFTDGQMILSFVKDRVYLSRLRITPATSVHSEFQAWFNVSVMIGNKVFAMDRDTFYQTENNAMSALHRDVEKVTGEHMAPFQNAFGFYTTYKF